MTADGCYGAYGLTYSAPFGLAGFAPATGPADVVISHGTTPTALVGATPLGRFWSASRDAVLIDTPSVVRHHVTRGGALTVERSAAYPDQDDLIYGVPIAATLAFAGLTVLHGAAAVPADSRGALLLLGANGVGKSSLAMALAGAGGRTICDNLAAIDVGNEAISLRAGPATVRLWADSASQLGLDTSSAPKVTADLQKYVLSRPPPKGPVPLAGIVELRPAAVDHPSLKLLEPRDATVAVIENVFRRRLMSMIDPTLMASAVTIASRIPVWRLARPVSGWPPHRLAELVADQLADVTPTHGACA